MAKRKNPQTSLDAYSQVHVDMLSAHHNKIIMALRRSKYGLMYEQIAAQVQLDKTQIGRRTGELVKKGLVYIMDEKRKTASGREAQVYHLTTAGEEYIMPDKFMPGKTVSQYSKDMQAVSAQLKLYE